MRSKIVICLLAILLVIIVVLPLTIEGDGSIAGLVQITLSYTLGLAQLVLSITTLWAGSAAISSEISDKTIQLIATKPVSRMRLWIGKWIGLSLLNAALLGVCGVATYAMLQLHLQRMERISPGRTDEASRILSARDSRKPEDADIESLVQARMRAIQTQDAPTAESLKSAADSIRREITVRNNTVKPGGHLEWRFGAIGGADTATTLTLQYKISSSAIGQAPVRGRWRIGTTDAPAIIDVEMESMPRRAMEVTFPMDDRWREHELMVAYDDLGEDPVSVIFDPGTLTLLVPRGGFAANYVRALLIVLGQLSFMAALGVSAGCLFSLPVASLVSFFLLLVIQMGSYIEGLSAIEIVLPGSGDAAMSWSTVAGALVFKCLAMVMKPLLGENVLEYVATGRMVAWSWTVNGLAMQGVVYSLLAGAISSWILGRRELALPSL